MILHYVAVGCIIFALAHHVVSGDKTRFYLTAANQDREGTKKNSLHKTVVADFLVTLACLSVAVLLLSPNIPAEIELGLGGLLILGPVALLVLSLVGVRGILISVRGILTLFAGALILSGVFLEQ